MIIRIIKLRRYGGQGRYTVTIEGKCQKVDFKNEDHSWLMTGIMHNDDFKLE